MQKTSTKQAKDNENEVRRLGDNVNIKIIQSVPKSRHPLSSIDVNIKQSPILSTPNLQKNYKRVLKTAPIKSSLKPPQKSAKHNLDLWQYKQDIGGCQEICKDLNIILPDHIQTPHSLFYHLQNKGILNPETLKVFAHCPNIYSVVLTNTYGTRTNDLGMAIPPVYSPKNCTIPFYTGYNNIQALDLTNVEITDEEIRYIIKLSNLKALGLSGTKITIKSIKYLAVNASFITTLSCLKLCHNEQITDSCILWINHFKSLHELDLLGTSVSKDGTYSFFEDDTCLMMLKCLNNLRLPVQIHNTLKELHSIYHNKESKFNILQCNTNEVKRQLLKHKNNYNDIYITGNDNELRKKLQKIELMRSREEILLKLCETFE